MAADTTKTITVLLPDVEACITRWERKGWNPISYARFTEPDAARRGMQVEYVAIVFAHMGKPK